VLTILALEEPRPVLLSGVPKIGDDNSSISRGLTYFLLD